MTTERQKLPDSWKKASIIFGISALLFGATVTINDASAAVLLAVDRETAGTDATLDTQSGFTSWSSGAGSVTVGAITLTETAQVADQGLRDRFNGAVTASNVIKDDPFEDLLRDFDHSSGAVTAGGWPAISLTLELSGLQMNTDYLVTLWGLDPVDNDGRGTSWYTGTSAIAPNLITSFFNNNSAPVPTPIGQVFSQVFNTGGGTTLSFYGEGDDSAQGSPLGSPNTATVVVFNGLQVESVPEPATLALMGLGLAGVGYQRRRKQS